MIIKVTQEHIDNGTKSDSCYCPVSLAIMGVLPLAVVYTNPATIFIRNKAGLKFSAFRKTLATPEMIGRFIVDFDKGYKVAPFEFELDL